jgi:hypothetical protein
MEYYAGLNVSLKALLICVCDGDGTVVWRGGIAGTCSCAAAMSEGILAV